MSRIEIYSENTQEQVSILLNYYNSQYPKYIMLNFNKTYFIYAILLLATEIFIALFINDNFIRPYVGDFLVVILLYCLVKSFTDANATITALGVLFFSYLIEALQYFNIVHHIGLHESKIANIIIGNYFSWIDILAYTLGILTVLILEKTRLKKLTLV